MIDIMPRVDCKIAPRSGPTSGVTRARISFCMGGSACSNISTGWLIWPMERVSQNSPSASATSTELQPGSRARIPDPLIETLAEEAAKARRITRRTIEDVEILARVDLTETPVQRLVELLHEHSVNGVILSAKHAYFEQVEAAIRACELEGVEA